MAEPTNSVSSLSLACWEFGWNVYKSLTSSSSSERNVFISPFCLHSILSMTYFGADGQTRYQIKDVLKLDFIKDDVLRDAYQSLTSKKSGNSTLFANRIYLDRSSNILDNFSRICKDSFSSKAVIADLGTNSVAEGEINRWVEEVTKGKIKDLIPSGSLTSSTFMVLVNAIYFKNQWDVKFDPDDTETGVFLVNDTEKIQVDFMHRNDRYNYGCSEELACDVIELPYKNKASSMIIILPFKNDGLSQLEDKLNTSSVTRLLDSMSSKTVNLHLPKFRLTYSMQLAKELTTLGMGDAFLTGKADLSQIDGTRNLYISDVFHKVVIDVNEEGTEVAAGGAAAINLRMLPPQFNADHPFLCLIRDNTTNILLFVGRVVKPESKK